MAPNPAPRPTLDETLARIDAVLAPGPIDDQQLQAVARHLDPPTLHVHRSAAQFADRISRMEWAATPPPTEAQLAAFRAVDDAFRRQLARAIGWFRR